MATATSWIRPPTRSPIDELAGCTSWSVADGLPRRQAGCPHWKTSCRNSGRAANRVTDSRRIPTRSWKRNGRRLKKPASDLSDAERQCEAIASRAGRGRSRQAAGAATGRARHHQAAVLNETAKLHQGDADNRRSGKSFCPSAWPAFDEIYKRLDVHFDRAAGRELLSRSSGGRRRSLRAARTGHGERRRRASCPDRGFDAPFMVQKRMAPSSTPPATGHDPTSP